MFPSVQTAVIADPRWKPQILRQVCSIDLTVVGIGTDTSLALTEYPIKVRRDIRALRPHAWQTNGLFKIGHEDMVRPSVTGNPCQMSAFVLFP